MAESSRTFYGGEPVTGAVGGELDAGKYDGPEAHARAPWKCPACGVQNEGILAQGCVHCGAGKPGYHVGLPPPDPALKNTPAFQAVQADLARGVELLQQAAGDVVRYHFLAWLKPRVAEDGNPWGVEKHEQLLEEAFRAGWIAGAQNQAHRTMAAPPVTVDVATLAPEAKAQRTIIAALQIFKDQILSQGPEEISTGEWMSIAEVDALITTLEAQL
jgi:hypothetical protein